MLPSPRSKDTVASQGVATTREVQQRGLVFPNDAELHVPDRSIDAKPALAKSSHPSLFLASRKAQHHPHLRKPLRFVRNVIDCRSSNRQCAIHVRIEGRPHQNATVGKGFLAVL